MASTMAGRIVSRREDVADEAGPDTSGHCDRWCHFSHTLTHTHTHLSMCHKLRKRAAKEVIAETG